ncbi:MAG: PqqD family peptide modification chaperone [Rhizobiaceae bacterium]|nr:PqqD family peptide modification chaperone [Rhizobiaceae bacterium]MCV0404722.1 PqqD family peptide modification chaperone [Rhizobiaceae bacterium]
MLVRCGFLGKTLRFDEAAEVLHVLRTVTEGWSLRKVSESEGDPEIGIRGQGDGFQIEQPGRVPRGEPSAVSAACSLVASLLNCLVEDDSDLLALHAGAVTFGGQAVVFPSTHRAGKSTLAAALAFQGHRLIAEDILPLDCNGAHISAIASGVAPRLRLPIPLSLGIKFRLSAWRNAGPDDGYYRYLQLPSRSRCRFGERFGIGAFLFLERDARHREPRLFAVRRADAMRILLLQNFGTAAPPAVILDRIEALTDQCPAYLLRYSGLGKAVSFLEAAFGSQALVEPWPRLQIASPDISRVAGVELEGRQAAALVEKIICRRRHVTVRQMDGSAFLADQTGGGIFALDPLGRAIWELMKHPVSTGEIAAGLCEAYPDIPPETIAADVSRLVEQFLENGLATDVGRSALRSA